MYISSQIELSPLTLVLTLSPLKPRSPTLPGIPYNEPKTRHLRDFMSCDFKTTLRQSALTVTVPVFLLCRPDRVDPANSRRKIYDELQLLKIQSLLIIFVRTIVKGWRALTGGPLGPLKPGNPGLPGSPLSPRRPCATAQTQA